VDVAVAEQAPRAAQLALRAGVLMLSSGAQAPDTERAMRRIMRGLGFPGAEAAVTHSAVHISWIAPGTAQPVTAMQAVRAWRMDFSRLSALSRLARDIHAGELTLPDAERALDTIARLRPPYPLAVRIAAAGLSAAGVTILFNGTVPDALATLAIGLLVQPVLAAIDRSDLPPLFQTVFGVAATTSLVALLVAVDVPVNGGLVLTGGLLQFLPGNAVVAGMRDLVDRSIVSGTARLAEGILLGGAVAAALGMVLAIAAEFGIRLRLIVIGAADWPLPVVIGASLVAVGFYAVGLGVPRGVLPSAAALGALAVLIGEGIAPGSDQRPVLVASVVVGVLGRALARWQEAPATLWTVPAILPLLPGLLIVRAMLASTSTQQVALLGDALLIAFSIGVGVAAGDIIVATYQQVRERIVEPAVGAVSGGITALVARPGAPDDAPAEEPARPS